MGKFDMRRCKNCGNFFEPKTWKQFYCGSECRLAHYTIEKQKRKAERSVNKNLTLTEIAVEAKKAGMTYGEYVAKHGL